ncbi:hypothetical protein BU15DRAFT_63610 [Melanogaster broomeanus]|nr:hypothetical protein BU15DRAFT_63610 [Melanogaster broomeanus]
MSITAGYHKIKTSSGKYLTLLSQTGNVTAQTSNGATNQTWDVQPAGSSTYTIRNTGYDTSTYAYSAGQNGSAVTGSTSSLEWSIVTSNGNYFFLPGSDNSLAWNVQDDGSVKLNGKQLTNSGQQFTIDCIMGFKLRVVMLVLPRVSREHNGEKKQIEQAIGGQAHKPDSPLVSPMATRFSEFPASGHDYDLRTAKTDIKDLSDDDPISSEVGVEAIGFTKFDASYLLDIDVASGFGSTTAAGGDRWLPSRLHIYHSSRVARCPESWQTTAYLKRHHGALRKRAATVTLLVCFDFRQYESYHVTQNIPEVRLKTVT